MRQVDKSDAIIQSLTSQPVYRKTAPSPEAQALFAPPESYNPLVESVNDSDSDSDSDSKSEVSESELPDLSDMDCE